MRLMSQVAEADTAHATPAYSPRFLTRRNRNVACGER